jgi:hypothetical protein
MHSAAIAALPGAFLGIGRPLWEYARAETCRTRTIASERWYFLQDATQAARIVDGTALVLTKLAHSGSCVGECVPVIAFVYCLCFEEIDFLRSVYHLGEIWNRS